MQVGMIGLGRMGRDMVRRLLKGGHDCVVYDLDLSAVVALVQEGATGAESIEELLARLNLPRVLWLMLPAALVDATISALLPHMYKGDIVIDGGNSYYRDDIRRAGALHGKGVHYVDVGTSGGVWGLDRGYCLMVGGEKEAVARLGPLFTTLAPGIDAAPRTQRIQLSITNPVPLARTENVVLPVAQLKRIDPGFAGAQELND